MSADQLLMMALRLLHIGAGIFWVGTLFFMNLFAFPAIQSAGADGPRIAALLMRGGKLQRAMIHAATITILAGLAMYILFIVQTEGAWARSASAMGYGVGAIAAIVGFVVGVTVNVPAARRLQALGGSGAPPTEAQQAEAARLRARMTSASRVTLWLLIVAVVSMAVSRYLT